MPRVLLLLATTTYRAEDFLAAAASMGIDVAVGAGGSQALADLVPESTLELDFSDTEGSLEAVVDFAADHPLDAIISAGNTGACVAGLYPRPRSTFIVIFNSPDLVRLAMRCSGLAISTS